MKVKWKSANFLPFMLTLQFITLLAVVFDVPVARQVVCFCYFTFIPGFIFLKILKLQELDLAEVVLFSVGGSIAFLMLSGILINELSSLGVSEPLSPLPLMIVLNCFVLMGVVIAHIRQKDATLWGSRPIEKSPAAYLLLALPILSVIGAFYATVYGGNLFLLLVIVFIASLFAIAVLSNRFLPSRLYPLAVFIIAIALLYHSSMIYTNILPFGSDVPGEYFVFKLTLDNGHWSSLIPFTGADRYNDMVSITILPTIYANVLNIGSQWVYKLLYPTIFSLVALGLYQNWRGCLGKKYAFVSVFLVMAQMTFYTEMLGLNRQMIAELFLVLLLLVLASEKLKPVSKLIFFMIFSFALVMSHYAIAAIFVFLITSVFVLSIVTRRPNKNITLTMVIFVFSIMFLWYIYAERAASFNSFVEAGRSVYMRLGEFLSPASRGETVLAGLGLAESPSVLNTVGRVFAYFTQGLIVLGYVALLIKRTKIHFERESLSFISIALAFLAALVLVPGLANTFNMTRFYHLLLIFLAPLFVIGAKFIADFLSKKENTLVFSVILLVVLVPYFLFQTNFVYEIAGSDSWSVSLSGYRMDPVRLYSHFGYNDAYDTCGAQWLVKKVNLNNSAVYADGAAWQGLFPFSGLVSGQLRALSNTTIVANNTVVFLGTVNTIYGVILLGGYNSSVLFPVLKNANLVYANSRSLIFERP